MPKTKNPAKGRKPGFDCLVIIEGEGEITAVPVLVNKLRGLDNLNPVKVAVWPRRHPMGKDQILGKTSITHLRQGGPPLPPPRVEALIQAGWAQTKGEVPVIILIDADGDRTSEKFRTAQQRLAPFLPQLAKKYNIDIRLIIAVQEYESWIVAVVDSIKGQHGLDARATYRGNTEAGPADPKRWLGKFILGGYEETKHQHKFTEAADWAASGCKTKAPRNQSLAEMYNAVKTL